MFAVIVTGGKQYKVQEGDVLHIEKLEIEAGQALVLDEILLIEKDGNVQIGKPTVAGAKVTAKVVDHGKAKKIIVFKYKAKKNYRRKNGHRQPYTKILIEKIEG